MQGIPPAGQRRWKRDFRRSLSSGHDGRCRPGLACWYALPCWRSLIVSVIRGIPWESYNRFWSTTHIHHYHWLESVHRKSVRTVNRQGAGRGDIADACCPIWMQTYRGDGCWGIDVIWAAFAPWGYSLPRLTACSAWWALWGGCATKLCVCMCGGWLEVRCLWFHAAFLLPICFAR